MRWILRVLRLPLWATIAAELWLTSWFWWLILRLFPTGKRRPFPLPGGDAVDKIRKVEGGSDKEVLDIIYRLLSILDTKASALMRYNSIILAAMAFLIKDREHPPHVTAAIVSLTIGSIVACLLVVGVFWRFYQFVVVDPAVNFGGELDSIRRVLFMREAAYQIAWWFAVAVLVILVLNLGDFIKQGNPR
jgi:hypothetical protein